MVSTTRQPRSAGSAEAADPEKAAYTRKIAHRGVWVEPSQLAEIEYRAKSAASKVRDAIVA